MTLGNLVIVEFGEHGNAAYAYRQENVPFDWSRRLTVGRNKANSLKNNKSAFKPFKLKNGAYKNSFRHVDTPEGSWEDRLAGQLKKYGINPDNAIAVKLSPPPGNPEQRPATLGTYSFDKLSLLAQRNNFRIEDHTGKGGCVWAYTHHHESLNQLRLWGFQYKEGKGWWLKP